MCIFIYKIILLYKVIILIIQLVDADGDPDTLEREASVRRAMEIINDQKWHVAHLKETDFHETDLEETRRVDSTCLPETFEEKIERYRKSLKNDAALIEYVSAHAVHVDESELIPKQCQSANETNTVLSKNNTQNSSNTADTGTTAVLPIMDPTTGNVQLEDENNSTSVSPVYKKERDFAFRASPLEVKSRSEIKKVTESSVSQASINTTIVSSLNDINTVSPSADSQTKLSSSHAVQKLESKKELNEGPEVSHQATTTTPKVKKKYEKPDARRGEYMFSSQEYYEDAVDFNVDKCPDDAEEVILTLDILRPYDVECELTLVWSSLED